MNDMLQTVFMTLIVVALLFLLVLVIYLVDRFNALERETQDTMRKFQESQQLKAGAFSGLSGPDLWEAMTTGRAGTETDLPITESMRQRYRLVLDRHVSRLFRDGVADANRGTVGTPAQSMNISTLRGQVESWLPEDVVTSLYRCGVDSTEESPDRLALTRQTLDTITQALFQRCNLPLTQPYSITLMPTSPESETNLS